MRRKRVAYVFPVSHRFRAPFHEQLRARLDARGVDYDYVHTDADPGGSAEAAAPERSETPARWRERTSVEKVMA